MHQVSANQANARRLAKAEAQKDVQTKASFWSKLNSKRVFKRQSSKDKTTSNALPMEEDDDDASSVSSEAYWSSFASSRSGSSDGFSTTDDEDDLSDDGFDASDEPRPMFNLEFAFKSSLTTRPTPRRLSDEFSEFDSDEDEDNETADVSRRFGAMKTFFRSESTSSLSTPESESNQAQTPSRPPAIVVSDGDDPTGVAFVVWPICDMLDSAQDMTGLDFDDFDQDVWAKSGEELSNRLLGKPYTSLRRLSPLSKAAPRPSQSPALLQV